MILLRWIGCQRFIYNAKVSEDRYFRKFAAKFGGENPVDQEYSRFIGAESQWLREVPSQVLRNGAAKWRQAYQRFYKRLGGRPTIHKKNGKQSVWLTSELFRFENGRLLIGTNKCPVGEVHFKAHREYTVPKSIHVSVEAGRWFVSFSTESKEPEYSDAEIASWLQTFTPEELAEHTLGLDRGVVTPIAVSDGRNFDFKPVEKKRIRKRAKTTKRLQRKLAKKTNKAGKRRARLRARIAVLHRKTADLRRDFAHQTSRKLANDENTVLYVVEDLKINNMTRSAKGTKAKPGKNVKQKAGLNRSILNAAWGQSERYLAYKARRKHKLVIKVTPYRSSQECAVCGHCSADNRISQSVFICQACGHFDNADTNAGGTLANRGVELIVSGNWSPKEVKRTSIRKVRCERPEPELITPTPGDEGVGRSVLRDAMLSSKEPGRNPDYSAFSA
jgi:putative transposase